MLWWGLFYFALAVFLLLVGFAFYYYLFCSLCDFCVGRFGFFLYLCLILDVVVGVVWLFLLFLFGVFLFGYFLLGYPALCVFVFFLLLVLLIFVLALFLSSWWFGPLVLSCTCLPPFCFWFCLVFTPLFSDFFLVFFIFFLFAAGVVIAFLLFGVSLFVVCSVVWYFLGWFFLLGLSLCVVWLFSLFFEWWFGCFFFAGLLVFGFCFVLVLLLLPFFDFLVGYLVIVSIFLFFLGVFFLRGFIFFLYWRAVVYLCTFSCWF